MQAAIRDQGAEAEEAAATGGLDDEAEEAIEQERPQEDNLFAIRVRD